MQGGLNYQKTLKHFSGLGSGYAIEWNEMDNNIGFLDVYMGKIDMVSTEHSYILIFL